MSSFTQTHAQGNNESSAALETGIGPAELRPPPTPADFARVTTRFMVAAREWVRTNRGLALEALKLAIVSWSGLLVFTVWRWRDRASNPSGGTAEKPGWGDEHEMTIDAYATKLAEAAVMIAPKGRLACVSLGRSRYRGSLDEECISKTGILLDSDDCGGWVEARELARSAGLAFAAQQRPVRPLGHHLEIPFAKPLVPVRDADGGVHAWKMSVYCPQLGWIMGVFSELAGLRYEPTWDGRDATAKYAGYDTTCDRLLQLNYIYHRRPGDPPGHVPVTDYATGGALDVERLLETTGFAGASALLERPRPNNAPAQPRSLARGGDSERVSDVKLLVRLHRLRNSESQELIGRLLTGQSYAPLGQRDVQMHRAAAIIAPLAPYENPEHLAKLLFEDSLVTMSTLPGADPVERYVETYLARAAAKIARAQRRVRGDGR